MFRRVCIGSNKADFQSALWQVANLLYLKFEMPFGTSRTSKHLEHLSFAGVIPVGNTGGANVPPVKPMQIPNDLKRIIEANTLH